MGKLKNYKGSIDLISGLRAKNNGDFPLMEAHDILVDESGTRLDEKLASMGEGGGTGGAYVLELTEESGTLTEEQYNAIVASLPHVVIACQGFIMPVVAYDDETVTGYLSQVGAGMFFFEICYLERATKEYRVDYGQVPFGGGGSTVIDLGQVDVGVITLTDEQFAKIESNPYDVVLIAAINNNGSISPGIYRCSSNILSLYMYTQTGVNDNSGKPNITSSGLLINPTTKAALAVAFDIGLANSKQAGFVAADPKTSSDTVPCRIGDDGKLYVTPSESGGGGGSASTPPTLLNDGGTVADLKVTAEQLLNAILEYVQNGNTIVFFDGKEVCACLSIDQSTPIVAYFLKGSTKQIIKLTGESGVVSASYVDIGGGGSGTGLETITFTDRPSAWAWLKENYDKVIQAQLISRDTFDPKYTTVAPVRDSYSGEVQKICFTSVFVSDLTPDDEPNGQRLTYSNNVAQITDKMMYIYFEPVNTDFIEPDQIVIQNEIGSLDDSFWDSYQIKLVCYYVGSSNGGGSYVLELSGESGTLTDEQYNKIVKSPHDVRIVYNSLILSYFAGDDSSSVFSTDSVNPSDGTTIMADVTVWNEGETHQWVGHITGGTLATTEYVDNAVANAGGGGSSGGMSVKSITFTDRPTAWEWLKANNHKVIKTTLSASILPSVVNYGSCGVGIYGNDGSIDSIIFTNVTPTEASASKAVLWLDYLSISYKYIQADLNCHQITFEDTAVNVTGHNTTTLDDDYWSEVSINLTCYYIE